MIIINIIKALFAHDFVITNCEHSNVELKMKP